MSAATPQDRIAALIGAAALAATLSATLTGTAWAEEPRPTGLHRKQAPDLDGIGCAAGHAAAAWTGADPTLPNVPGATLPALPTLPTLPTLEKPAPLPTAPALPLPSPGDR
ncbi:hypothetical protein [Streptomyces orinoci]|uniref:Secreted protein n=1 Tax=Streptomyces orinoci TaxID=67339 RepID=A0ABV3K847_STRON|nr:hypothetical protein [Streptomyces orinoci]